MIDDLIQHLRNDAQGHRDTFTKTNPPGGKNAELFDRWADEVEDLRSQLEESQDNERVVSELFEALSMDHGVLQERVRHLEEALKDIKNQDYIAGSHDVYSYANYASEVAEKALASSSYPEQEET